MNWFAALSAFGLASYGAATPPRLFFKLKPEIPIEIAGGAIQSKLGTEIQPDFARIPRLALVSFPSDAALKSALTNLEKTGWFEYIEEDGVVAGTTFSIPNDPLFNQQWGFRNTGQSGGTTDFDLNIDPAWDLQQGQSFVKVLIIDNGVQGDHADLTLGFGANFNGQPGNGTPVSTFDNHGTCVAGVIGAKLNNALLVAGIAPGVTIGSARPHVMTSANGFTAQASDIVAAIGYSLTTGCRITNNSNGYATAFQSVADAYASTRAAGVAHFAASGNSGVLGISNPANLPTVFAVGGVDRFGGIWSNSNFGPEQDFVGPALDIRLLDRDPGGYSGTGSVNLNGTSFASPAVAGIAALAVSANRYLTPDGIQTVLASTARDLEALGWDIYAGWGLPRADAAVQKALSYRLIGNLLLQNRQSLVDPIQVSYDLPTKLQDGSFTGSVGAFNWLAPVGPFEVSISSRPFLTKKFALNNSSTVSLGNVTLVNGDVNGDNEIGASDFDQIVAKFGLSVGDSLYSAYADLDGDGEIGSTDFDIVVGNFGQSGD